MYVANCIFHVASAVGDKDLVEMYLSAMEGESDASRGNASTYRDFVISLWESDLMTCRQFCPALTESLKWKRDVGCNLFVPSQMFPNQIYHERLKSSPRVKTEYGLRVEHVQLGAG